MPKFKISKIAIKIIALFSVVRGYNLLVLILAEYLAAIFIFSKENPKQSILNPELNWIVAATTLSVAAGYIINNFYDLEKDKIDKPIQHYVNRFIAQSFKLSIYLILNSLALIFASLVSYRVFIFFFVYQFMVWLYSHKINKIVIINNLLSVIVRILPFFALFIFYKNFTNVVFVHAVFLMSLLLILDIAKDLSSKTADLIYNYKTIPVVFGNKAAKYCVSLVGLGNMLVAFYLANYFPTGFMRYYFYFSIIVLLLLFFWIWIATQRTSYKIIYQIIKLLIFVGVISIVFIKINPLALQEVITSQ